MAVDIDKMTNVLVVYNTEDAEEVEVRLRMEKIVCARKKIGSGKHGNFLLAMNNFGEEIYVNPEEETAARAVIEDWRREKKEERENAVAAHDCRNCTCDHRCLIYFPFEIRQ